MLGWKEYLRKSKELEDLHFWDLPNYITLGVDDNKIRVSDLKRLHSREGIESKIKYIYPGKRSEKMPIKFPIKINSIDFVRLYSLMVSEGSTKTEFALHVPEKESHDIFEDALKNILGAQITIVSKLNKGIMRSRTFKIVKYLLPVRRYNFIPKDILLDENLSKEYLRIAFECEGSPIISGNKRYVSLKRNVDITEMCGDELTYSVGDRVYALQLKKEHPALFERIVDNPCPTILGEHLILENVFGIRNKIELECIRINHTDRRKGKIAARWALYIYARNINRFIEKIDFISENKRSKTKRMLNFNCRNEQFFSLELIKKITKKGVFLRRDFVKEMKELGYKSPQAYLWRYEKSGKIKRVDRGKYKLFLA